MKKLLLVAAAVALSNTASADAWWPFDAGNKAATFLNLETKKCESNVCTLWIGEVNIDKEKPYDTALYLAEFKCKSGEIRQLAGSRYLKGQHLRSNRYEDTWSYVTPGSLGYELMEYACGFKKPPEKTHVFDKPLFKIAPMLQDVLRESQKR